jgi:hypothetical protein
MQKHYVALREQAVLPGLGWMLINRTPRQRRNDMASEKHLTALKRLWKRANGASGQCKIVATFLLALFNPYRFHFEFNNLRIVDDAIYDDINKVIELDRLAEMNICEHLEVPEKQFGELAKDWGIKEFTTRG